MSKTELNKTEYNALLKAFKSKDEPTIKLLVENDSAYDNTLSFSTNKLIIAYKMVTLFQKEQIKILNDKIKELTLIKGVMSEQELVNSHVLEYI